MIQRVELESHPGNVRFVLEVYSSQFGGGGGEIRRFTLLTVFLAVNRLLRKCDKVARGRPGRGLSSTLPVASSLKTKRSIVVNPEASCDLLLSDSAHEHDDSTSPINLG